MIHFKQKRFIQLEIDHLSDEYLVGVIIFCTKASFRSKCIESDFPQMIIGLSQSEYLLLHFFSFFFFLRMMKKENKAP